MARFGDGLALGPDLSSAAVSAVEQALAPLSAAPDLVCVFVTGDDPDEIEAAVAAAERAAGPTMLLGCSASGVIGAGRGVEERGAVSAWAAVLPGARLDAFRLETLKADDRLVVVGMPEGRDDDVVGVLLADPYSFPVDAFVERSDEALPGLPLVGGLAEGGGPGDGGQGDARLFVGGDVYRDGAVGVVIGGSVAAATVVSQGARPIGPDMVVTKAEENVLYELAGVPALEKLEQIVLGLPEEEQELAGRGLLIGVAMDEYADEHEHGDFLVRGVVGADPDSGAIAIGDVVDVGRTVRFQVRDAGAAEEDLAALLERFDLSPVEGALLFSCNGRGQAMFPDSDHDAKVLDRAFGPAGVGGFFAAGEIGPVSGRNHVHGFTASILAFGRAGDRPGDPMEDVR
ncbi:Small ligand-binding sensory domain FIST [Actinomadura meyerae]|jgi:small ligand-binding sensory domain FIST|uniref:Small ligand-binding sensory domain FIST n=1 Tax=Actinomadura meyerae TaxID=240840 RepID=A0A239FZA0_9ACTN|nr:FIST N-terminal domain-containing protein [Actinomadura meyerae]SNS62367.1 Small ligand-binding sensory domain FIST [Actinomadura meyerae]